MAEPRFLFWNRYFESGGGTARDGQSKPLKTARICARKPPGAFAFRSSDGVF